jgi:fibronectin-binding autotransporter adhesin
MTETFIPLSRPLPDGRTQGIDLKNRLRASTSFYVLGALALLSFGAPRVAVAACTIDVVGNPASGPVSNSAAINCIAIDNSTVNGNITNTAAGTVTATGTAGVSGTGINIINNSVINGTIVNNGSIIANTNGIGIASGTVTGGISNSGMIRAGFDGMAIVNPTFFGGVTNSGTITAGSIGIVAFSSSIFSGGITNNNSITGNSTAIRINQVTTFSGGISNTGMLIGGVNGILVENTPTFLGGVTNSGTISAGGTGILFQNTAGVSVFDSGTITGTGGTAIQFSTGSVGNVLTLGPGFVMNGNALGAGSDTFQLGGSGTGSFNLSTLGTQYTGFSMFNVIGGTWQATGSNTNNWTVSGGNLQVGPDASPNASITGTVTLTGGMLSGLGTVGSIVNTAGTVKPGGSIGTLTVGGNYTQGAGATLAIEVSPTAASQLKVGGAVSLAGTLSLIYDPGVYTTHNYTIVSAGSVTGKFATILGNTPNGVTQTIVYDPADVMLELTGTGVTTPTTPIVIAPTNDTVYLDVTSQLVLNGQRANAIILDRVGNRAAGVADGEVALVGASVTGLQLAQASNGAVLGDFASALPQALAPRGAWFRGLGDFASVSSNGAIPGFNGSAGGFLAGFDQPVAANVYLGVAGGYLHSIVNERGTGSNGDADTARFAVYGGAFLGPSLLTATAGYAHDWLSTNRPFAGIGTAAESHSGNEATVAGQWSLPLQIQGLGQGLATLTPKAGFQFLHLGENGFNETGSGGLDLASNSRSTDSFQPFVALSASQNFITADGTLITPEARLGYDREVLSGARTLTVATIGGAQFPVTGIKPAKNILTAGAGVTAKAAPNLTLYLTYDAVVPTGNVTDQTVQGGLRIQF